jgi:hypothetical protein
MCIGTNEARLMALQTIRIFASCDGFWNGERRFTQIQTDSRRSEGRQHAVLRSGMSAKAQRRNAHRSPLCSLRLGDFA